MALGYDGSIRIDTKINSKGFNTGISSMIGSLGKLAAAVGIAFSVTAIVNFGKESIKAASNLSSALIGLQSIVEGQGRSFGRAQAFIQDYIKDGLIPMQDAVTAYKNLAMRGYGTEEIEKTLVALKDSATFGRQASLTMGEAVASATEGLKNENSILVDNAGVTKNVSVMWAEYAKQLGVGVQSLTKEQKIQAEVNGILQETRFQTGDAAKAVDTYAGQISMLGFRFTQLKVEVGNALIPIAKAVLPGINAIISGLMTLANVFAQVTSLLFGGGGMKEQASTQDKIASSASSAAGATDDLSKSTTGMGSASKKAAKDIKSITAGFDELNVLASQTASSMSEAAGGVGDLAGGLDIGELDVGGGELFGDVTVSQEVIDFIENLKTALSPTVDAMKALWTELERFGGFVWAGLNDFYERFLVPVGTWVMGEGIPKFVTVLKDGLALVDWGKINDSLSKLWDALAPFAVHVGEGLLWLWENVLVPFGTWTMNEVVPRFIDMLASNLELFNGIIEIVKPGIDWLWSNFLYPIASWTGGAIESILDGILSVLRSFGDWVNENSAPITNAIIGIGTAFASIKIAEFLINVGGVSGAFSLLHTTIDNLVVSMFKLVGAFAAKTAAIVADKIETLQIIGLYAKDFVVSVASSIANLAKETAAWVTSTAAKAAYAIQQGIATAATLAWNAAVTVGTALTTAFGAAVAFLTSPIGLVVAAVAALIAIIVLLATHWDEVKAAAISAWEKIKGVWELVSSWFNTSVVEPISKFFSGMWKNISTWASDAWNAVISVFTSAANWFDENVIKPITSGFKGFVNGLIGYVEGFINFFVRGINKIIDTVNMLSFDIPDVLGGGTIGFNLPNVPEIKLPRLATGAVIPPNSEFAAILGDQKSGRNFEAPESLLRKIVREEMSGFSGGGDFTVTMPVYLDSREIYRGQQTVSRERGRSLVKGLV